MARENGTRYGEAAESEENQAEHQTHNLNGKSLPARDPGRKIGTCIGRLHYLIGSLKGADIEFSRLHLLDRGKLLAQGKNRLAFLEQLTARNAAILGQFAKRAIDSFYREGFAKNDR